MREINPGNPALGWAEIKPDFAFARQQGTWKITYHCGQIQLETGAKLAIYPPFTYDNAHNSCVRWKAGTVTVCSESSAQLSVAVTDRFKDNPLSAKYTIEYIEVTVEKGCLSGGDSVEIIMGDQRNNGSPAEAQWLSGPDMPFYVTVAMPGSDDFKLLANCPKITVYGNRPDRLIATIPSTVQSGGQFDLRMKAEDKYTNISPLYQSPVNVLTGEAISGPSDTAICLHDNGQWKIKDYRLHKNGTYRIEVKDGPMNAQSNPVSTEFTEGNEKVYWGEIHGHTELSDGVGSENRFYEYARDEVWLDFASLSEHRGGGEWWPCCKEAANKFNDPGSFVTLLGYESNWGGGHCNVYGIDDHLPLLHMGSEKDRGSLSKLIRKGKAILVPHHTNDPLINELALFPWEEKDPNLIHVTEICQMRGSFEKDKVGEDNVLFGGYGCSIQDGLKQGFKFGFIGGSDNHCGRLASPMYNLFQPGPRIGSGTSCDIKKEHLNRHWCGITAIFASELTREAVFTALRNRNCYATTGARILINFKMNQLSMGQSGKIDGLAEARVKVAGTGPIKSVVVVRNNVDVFKVDGDGLDIDFTWEDEKVIPGSWYYIRVAQEDKHMAWSSPIWCD